MNYSLLVIFHNLVSSNDFIYSGNIMDKLIVPFINVYEKETEEYFKLYNKMKNEIYIIFNFNLIIDKKEYFAMVCTIQNILYHYNEIQNCKEFYFSFKNYDNSVFSNDNDCNYYEFLLNCYKGIPDDLAAFNINEMTFFLDNPLDSTIFCNENLKYGFLCNINMISNDISYSNTIKSFNEFRDKKFIDKNILCLALEFEERKNEKFLKNLERYFENLNYNFLEYKISIHNLRNISMNKFNEKFKNNIIEKYLNYDSSISNKYIFLNGSYQIVLKTGKFTLIIDLYISSIDKIAQYFKKIYNLKVIRCFRVYFKASKCIDFEFYVVFTWKKRSKGPETYNLIEFEEKIFIIKYHNCFFELITSYGYKIFYKSKKLKTLDKILNMFLVTQAEDNKMYNLFNLSAHYNKLKNVSGLFINYILNDSKKLNIQNEEVYNYNIYLNRSNKFVKKNEYMALKFFFDRYSDILNNKKNDFNHIQESNSLKFLFIDDKIIFSQVLSNFSFKKTIENENTDFVINDIEKYFLIDKISIFDLDIDEIKQKIMNIDLRDLSSVEFFYYYPELSAYKNINLLESFIKNKEIEYLSKINHFIMIDLSQNNFHFICNLKSKDNKILATFIFYYYEIYHKEFLIFYNSKIKPTNFYFINRTEELLISSNYFNNLSDLRNKGKKSYILNVCNKIFKLFSCQSYFGLILNLKGNSCFIKGLIAYFILFDIINSDLFDIYFRNILFVSPENINFDFMISFKRHCNENFIERIHEILKSHKKTPIFDDIFKIFDLKAKNDLFEFKIFLVINNHTKMNYKYFITIWDIHFEEKDLIILKIIL